MSRLERYRTAPRRDRARPDALRDAVAWIVVLLAALLVAPALVRADAVRASGDGARAPADAHDAR